MEKKPIDVMVDRFLGWKLPDDFCPDAGVSFKRDFNEHTNYPMKHEPVGTNLLTADQAKAMLEYVLDGQLEELEDLRRNLEFAYKRAKVLADLLGIPVHESSEVTGTILGLVRGKVEKLITS